MMIIEKLEQEIESLENSFEQLAIVDDEIVMVHTATIAGLKMAINIAKQHSEWVSVDERLPELGERVLTFTASGIETLYRSQYDNDLFIWERDCCQDYWTDEQVTHWMPISQPPKQ